MFFEGGIALLELGDLLCGLDRERGLLLAELDLFLGDLLLLFPDLLPDLLLLFPDVFLSVFDVLGVPLDLVAFACGGAQERDGGDCE